MNGFDLDSPQPRRLKLAALLVAASSSVSGVADGQLLPPIGLSAARTYLFEEAGPFPADPGEGDLFGSSFAVGDFNQDGFDDLATGIPDNPCDADTDNCGAVQIRFGARDGALFGALAIDPNGVGQFGQTAPEPTLVGDDYGRTLAAGDFNNDGYEDLAVGVPGNGPFSANEIEGGVQIHYGLHGSLGSIEWVAEHFLASGVSGVPGPETTSGIATGFENRFGATLAAGDFNGDGHDDLAIGVPFGEVLNTGAGPITMRSAGNVFVAHGHVGGLVPFEGFLMKEGLQGLPGVTTGGDEFGAALAAGDLNGDGFDDLVIGVPNENGVGAVLAVYGSENSLLFAVHQYLDHSDLGGVAQLDSRFGSSLAVGDFDGDGFDDLAAGAAQYDLSGTVLDVGLVSAIRGSASGLVAGSAFHFYEDLLFGPGASEFGDLFGTALAAGDLNGDGIDDLAVGAPREKFFQTPDTGVVTVMLGQPGWGLQFTTMRQLFARGRASEPGGFRHDGMIPDYRDGASRWGSALASGDFDGNGFDDLAVGAPTRDRIEEPLRSNSGAVAALFGHLFIDGFESQTTDEWTGSTP